VQLVRTHPEQRHPVAALRTGLLAGDLTRPPADFLSHCLGLCAALHTHHTGEDEQLLPALGRARPELAPLIDKLVEDHRLIAGILRRMDELVAEAVAHPDDGTAAIVRELDGLAAVMSSHFGFEERSIGAALDAVGVGARVADVFGVLPPRT
jgi:hypothetical protein